MYHYKFFNRDLAIDKLFIGRPFSTSCVITLVSREKRQIVGYDIAFDKSRERIQKLVDSSPKAEHDYSDACSAYAEICYEGRNTSLKNKSQTYTVESVNSDLR